ncbi:hypothetical protein C8J57DRAFT_1216449 [Mycena rebaudengoi]|nr:hypothetical protein C8J57DRAFT_1216449 [Mycena rebaudengoi]
MSILDDPQPGKIWEIVNFAVVNAVTEFLLGIETYGLLEDMGTVLVGLPPLEAALTARARLWTQIHPSLLFTFALWSPEVLKEVWMFVTLQLRMMKLGLTIRIAKLRAPKGTTNFINRFPAELQTEILTHVDLATFRTWGATCAFYHKFFADTLHDNIVQMMIIFGLDWTMVRWMMEATDSHVGGVVAFLALFLVAHNRLLFAPTSLDIYTTRHHAAAVLRFFFLHADYRIHSRDVHADDASNYFDNLLYSVIHLARPGFSCLINVHVARTGSSIMPMLRQPVTLLMNWLSSRGIFSANAEATFNFFGVLNTSAVALDSVDAVVRLFDLTEKLRNNGISYGTDMAEVPHICSVHALCPLTIRTTIDSHTFFMKFEIPTAGAPVTNKVRNDAAVFCWGLGGMPCIDNGFGRSRGFVRFVYQRFQRRAEEYLTFGQLQLLWRARIAMVHGAPTGRQVLDAASAHFRSADAEREGIEAHEQERRARVQSELVMLMMGEEPESVDESDVESEANLQSLDYVEDKLKLVLQGGKPLEECVAARTVLFSMLDATTLRAVRAMWHDLDEVVREELYYRGKDIQGATQRNADCNLDQMPRRNRRRRPRRRMENISWPADLANQRLLGFDVPAIEVVRDYLLAIGGAVAGGSADDFFAIVERL